MRRADSTLARRVAFGPASHIEVSGADLGLFVQDRWRPASRLLFELGTRVDRDGTLDRFNFTPRSGVALLLKSDGSVMLRGGAGLFYERTPLVVQAFSRLTRIETRYAADGVTPLGPPIWFVNRIDGPLQTPAAATWNIDYSHRLNAAWSFRASHLQRHGMHEFVVDPRVDGTAGELLLSSTGRSTYRETELAARFSAGRDFDLSASYIRSHSAADLNNYSSFFGAERNAVIDGNEFGPTPGDAPNRIVARMRAMVAKMGVGLVCRDPQRLPLLGGQRVAGLRGGPEPGGTLPRGGVPGRGGGAPGQGVEVDAEWVGVRMLNALNSFSPLDVQRNIESPFFGTFYNAVPRQFRLTLRIK